MTREEVLSLAKKQYNRKTPEERKEEIQELSSQAFSQIEKYTHSPEELLEYANFLSKFHSYSPNNTALIHEQFQGANAVASFKDWKDKGYSVNKGEKGIKILSFTPITYFKDENGERRQISTATKQEKELIKQKKLSSWKVNSFKIGHVFDVSQTNAPIEDLPNIFPNRQFNFEIEEGNNIAHLKKGIQAVAKNLNIEINDMSQSKLGLYELGGAKGAFVQGIDQNKKEIVMNSRNTETQAIATSIHELAHAKLHDLNEKDSDFDSPTKEFQAELTSYIVCKHFGMDTSEKAIPYIASWTKNGEKIEDKQRAIEGVHKTSQEFIEIMDRVISQEREKEIVAEYPRDPDMVRYCELTGKPFANQEPYFYVNGYVYSEEAHEFIFTDEEWLDIYNSDSEENYWTEEVYDLSEDELTTEVPKHIGNKDIYYRYDPNNNNKPEKIGTISDLVSKGDEFTREFKEAFIDNMYAEKDTFEEAMEKHHIMKNPTLTDFQRANERAGYGKNENLAEIQNEHMQQQKMAYMRQQSMQR